MNEMKGNLNRNQRHSPHRQSPEAKTARKRAVAYLRVSSAEQEREGFSIPAQRKLLHEYAEGAGIQIVHEFVDVETAKKAGRTGFSEMVSFVSKHQCQTILVEKTDRLYRNIKDWVLIDELGPQAGLEPVRAPTTRCVMLVGRWSGFAAIWRSIQ